MVTKRDDNRQSEYRVICLWKIDWQSFAIQALELDASLDIRGLHTHSSFSIDLVFFSARVTQQGLRVRAQIILGGQRGRYYQPIIDHL